MTKTIRRRATATATILAVAGAVLAKVLLEPGSGQSANTSSQAGSSAPATDNATVELTASQLQAIKIAAVETRSFSSERTAMGNIDYNEDRTVQVFTSYSGRIAAALADLGDEVKKGEPLFTIDSSDLVQAESALIGAAVTYDLTQKELARAKFLLGTNGVSEREMEQATSDAQTAEGSLTASRNTVHVFGKSDAEISQILASHKIDSKLAVASPITGRVIARSAQAGLLVQPGNSSAPYTVADLTTKWMVGNVTESDCPMLHVGERVQATVMAYPGRIFGGKISKLGASVDPNTHRAMVRCEVADAKDELRPGMLATFVISVQDDVESVSLPMNAVVRNGDGTLAAWVTTDRRRFVQRIIKIGLQQDGQYQVLEGLQHGELAVTDGAIFLSNILYAPPAD